VLVNRPPRAVVAAMLLAIALTSRASSAADDGKKERCSIAYEQAQVLRRSDQLTAALAQLLVCRDTCPPTLVKDCESWIGDITTVLPTVRLRALDASGAPLRTVNVFLDGKLLVQQLSDGPVTVDPGEHVFRFEPPGASAAGIDVKIALRAGEHDRDVTASFASTAKAPAPPTGPAVSHRPSAATPPAATAATATSPPPATAPAADHTASYVLGAIGVVSLAAAGILTIKGYADRSHLESTCSPHCTLQDTDPIARLWWTAAALAGVGVISLTTSIVLWRPAPDNGAAAKPSPTGLVVGVAGRF